MIWAKNGSPPGAAGGAEGARVLEELLDEAPKDGGAPGGGGGGAPPLGTGGGPPLGIGGAPPEGTGGALPEGSGGAIIGGGGGVTERISEESMSLLALATRK